jgi:hypothetical protein
MRSRHAHLRVAHFWILKRYRAMPCRAYVSSILSTGRRDKSSGDRDGDRCTGDHHQHSAESLVPSLRNAEAVSMIHRCPGSEDRQKADESHQFLGAQ